MRDNKVEITGMEKGFSIDEIRIDKKVNEHGKAIIKGTTDKKTIKEILSSSDEIPWISIKIGESETGDATETIFSGIVDNISLESCDSLEKVKKVTVEVVGSSCLLDIKKEIYTYQEKDSELAKIKECIENNFKNNYSGVSINLINGKNVKDSDQPKCKMLVQYNETDYEFLKRCAALKNYPLINIINNDKCVNINIGFINSKKSGNIDGKLYKEVKNLRESLFAKKQGLESVSDKDYEMVEVRTREYFDLGSQVTIDGKTLYVYSARSKYGVKTNEDKAEWIESNDDTEHTSSVFYHVYELADEKRFKTPRIYNEKMIGASLSATVSDVNKDKIKIKCDCDGEKSEELKEFPYATVYSSKDGTGWYCMPEIDDKVRLYLPTDDEEDAYVISAVHLKGAELRNNPNVKFIMNKHKKEVRFDEKSIKISNNEGMEIVLDDEKGISILSDKDIDLMGSKDVCVLSKSGSLNVSGSKNVSIKQGASASIEIDRKIKHTSMKIEM